LLYGGYLETPQPFKTAPFKEGALGQLLSPRFGLFTVAPVALAALLCWPKFLTQGPRAAAVLGAGFLSIFLLLSVWDGWNGMAFGPRYLVPVLPLLFAALATAGPRLAVPLLGGRLTLALAVYSAAVTADAAFHYCKYWLKNPALELAVDLWRLKLSWPTP